MSGKNKAAWVWPRQLSNLNGGGRPLARVFQALALIAFLGFLLLPARQAAAQDDKNFIWRLDSPQGGHAYIVGSLHLAHQGLYPLNEKIMKAFGESDFLMVEINSEDMNPAALASFIRKYGYVDGGPPLPDRLSERTALALKNSGFYQAAMAQMTPWLAALAIQVEALHQKGFKSEYGLDKYFIDLAKERKIRILELESLDQQMGMLVEMSPQEADLFLLSTLMEMEELPKMMTALLENWEKGKVDDFAQVFFAEYDKYPELKPLLDKIIFRRNQEMAAKIEDLTSRESGAAFIVVGAGHLVGGRSILAELAGRGWRAGQL